MQRSKQRIASEKRQSPTATAAAADDALECGLPPLLLGKEKEEGGNDDEGEDNEGEDDEADGEDKASAAAVVAECTVL
jgi:hypothetical protein